MKDEWQILVVIKGVLFVHFLGYIIQNKRVVHAALGEPAVTRCKRIRI